MHKVLSSRGNGVQVTPSTPATSRSRPLQAEGAVEQIVRRLGEAIGAGVLAPGERLPSEVELAAQLGVAP